MPRPPNIIRPTLLHLALPKDIREKVDGHLYSELEGRVPKGAYQRFFMERIHEFFSWSRLDLTPYGFPQGFYVAGPPEILEKLDNLLKRHPL